jgi:hypothetical protein
MVVEQEPLSNVDAQRSISTAVVVASSRTRVDRGGRGVLGDHRTSISANRGGRPVVGGSGGIQWPPCYGREGVGGKRRESTKEWAMRKLSIAGHVLAVIIAASYVTLIISDISSAKKLVPLYGTVFFVLTLFNLWSEYHAHKS